jgi:glutamate-ammonia-ligase adenylyltransferase
VPPPAPPKPPAKTDSPESLRALGFAAPAAALRRLSELESLGWEAERCEDLLRIAGASPDPDRAFQTLVDWTKARTRRGRPPERERPGELALLAAVAGSSEPLARAAVARPTLVSASVALQQRPLDPDALERSLGIRLRRAADRGLEEAQRVLRAVHRRQIFRIVARELLGRADVLEAAREMSQLAAVIARAAVAYCQRRLEQDFGAPAAAGRGFCVIAMGKLGGEELNFSSDIDLLFMYAGDGETAGGAAGRTTHREFYARLAELFIRLVGEATAEGRGYRVDTNLRPEGRSGPLVNPLEALRGYYETYGRTWERLALLRAAPLAGDRALGQTLLRALQPFIFRTASDFTVLDEIRALKARIELEASRRGDDVKLGRGGIREIEFVAQTLSLLHGGRLPSLRQRTTRPLFEALAEARILPATDRDQLLEAYVFLRRVEHRLQMLEERQTHLLPSEDEARRLLARRLGYAGPRAREEFETDLASHRDRVHVAFESLLAGSATAGARPAPRWVEPEVAAAADPGTPHEERLQLLATLGFHDTDGALTELTRLGRPSAAFGPGTRAAGRALLPNLLQAITQSPDPDRALTHFADWASALRATESYLQLLDERPEVLRLLMQLFGGSDLLSREFLRHPELLDALLPGRPPNVAKGEAQLREELTARLAGADGDLETQISRICRARNEEVLRIGLLDLAGQLDVREVSHQLSDLASAVIQVVLPLAVAETTARFGLPGEGATLAVVALGSLGGRESSYGSDLDLLFLYSSAGETSGGTRAPVSNHEYFARAAQRLIGMLELPVREGSLYSIDSRLRPSGSHGSLVSSLDAFRQYHAGHSALWERQSLLRARLVAGDPRLFARAAREVIEPALFRPESDRAAMAQEIARLRGRMERELAGEDQGAYNPKSGLGGSVDIEFSLQFLQLLHGHQHPSVRSPETFEALETLDREGLLERAAAGDLREGLRFLRKLDARLRIAHDLRRTHLPSPGSRALEILARQMGLGSGAQLLERYQQTRQRVRDLFQRIVA